MEGRFIDHVVKKGGDERCFSEHRIGKEELKNMSVTK
jgi:hypothetical protein